MTDSSFSVHRKFSFSKEYGFAFRKERFCCLVYCIDAGFGELSDYLNRLLLLDDVFEIIVAVESGKVDISMVSAAYPDSTVIEFFEKPSKAETIDVACRIMLSPFFMFVDMSVLPLCVDFSRLLPIFSSYKNPLVVTPVFVMNDRAYYPNIRIPDVKYMSIICEQLHPFYRLQDTFYPISFIGVYDRLKYMRIGGFDLTIDDDYYQLLEFASRVWFSGYSIMCYKEFVFHCTNADNLTEHIRANRYKDAINFRIQYLYKRPRDKVNIKVLYFLFRAVDDSFKDSVFKNRFFLLNFKMLLKRWRIGEIEEVL